MLVTKRPDPTSYQYAAEGVCPPINTAARSLREMETALARKSVAMRSSSPSVEAVRLRGENPGEGLAFSRFATMRVLKSSTQ